MKKFKAVAFEMMLLAKRPVWICQAESSLAPTEGTVNGKEVRMRTEKNVSYGAQSHSARLETSFDEGFARGRSKAARKWSGKRAAVKFAARLPDPWTISALHA